MFWCQSPFCLFQLACEQASLGRNRPELLTHTQKHTDTQGDNHCAIQLLEERLAIEKVKPNRKHGGFRPLLTPHGTYSKSCYKFQICNDLPHLHACKLLVCTRGKLRANVAMAAKPYIANLLQTRCKLIILQRVCTRANLMQIPNLHRICIFANL